MPRGNGGTNAGMRARGNSVCLGSVARKNFWGAGNSSQQAGAQKESGCAGVRMESVVSTSGGHRTVVTGPGPGLRDHREVTGGASPDVLTHPELCSTVQQKPETEQKCNCQNQEEKPLLPARCLQRLLLTKLNTVLSVKEEKCLKESRSLSQAGIKS